MKFKRSNLELQINKSPKNVVWCKNCVLSNQRPRVIFNKDNICSACINLEYKKNFGDRYFHRFKRFNHVFIFA